MKRLFKKIKDKLYARLVEKNEKVRTLYQNYVDHNKMYHQKHRIRSWRYLMALNRYYKNGEKGDLPMPPKQETATLPKPPKPPIKPTPTPPVKKPPVPSSPVQPTPKPPAPKLPAKPAPKPPANSEKQIYLPEYRHQFRHDPVTLAKMCNGYDVISFDMFDTLIFRYLEKPEDVFFYLETKLQIPNFKRYRMLAEKNARLSAPGNEVTIFEIYDELEQLICIDKEATIQQELEAELHFCHANPFIKKVYDSFVIAEKPIIVVSNMYWPAPYLKQILENAGYTHIDRIFSSCDLHLSKRDGRIFRYVEKNYLHHRSVMHIGDNYPIDVIQAQKCGWKAYHFPLCNIFSTKYRPKTPFSLAGSLYRGIVATNIHGGMGLLHPFDRAYEFGFIYGGLLIAGFCQYIDRVCKEQKVDKILFLARDGDIVQQVYRRHFGHVDNEYMCWSRFMGELLDMDGNIMELIAHNVNAVYDNFKDATVELVLQNIGCEFLEEHLTDYHLTMDTVLDIAGLQRLRNYLTDRQTEIIAHFAPMKRQAKEYYQPFLQGTKKVLLVDVGWSGRSLICFQNFAKNTLGYQGTVIGTMLGCYDREFTNAALHYGLIYPYQFSTHQNKNLSDQFATNYFTNSVFFEQILASPVPSSIAFDLDNPSDKQLYTLQYGVAITENNRFIKTIHRGVLDFCNIFFKVSDSDHEAFCIFAEDAFAPVYEFSKHPQWIRYTFEGVKFNLFSGFSAKTADVLSFLKEHQPDL